MKIAEECSRARPSYAWREIGRGTPSGRSHSSHANSLTAATKILTPLGLRRPIRLHRTTGRQRAFELDVVQTLQVRRVGRPEGLHYTESKNAEPTWKASTLHQVFTIVVDLARELKRTFEQVVRWLGGHASRRIKSRAIRLRARTSYFQLRIQNPLGRIQKLSCQVPPGGMLWSSLYRPFCARLSASVMPAIGSMQMNVAAASAPRSRPRGSSVRARRRAAATCRSPTSSRGPCASRTRSPNTSSSVVVAQRDRRRRPERAARSARSRRSGSCSARAASASARPPTASTRRASNRSAESTGESRSRPASARRSCSRSASAPRSTPSCSRWVISIVCANGHCLSHAGWRKNSSRLVTQADLRVGLDLDHLPLVGRRQEAVNRNRAADVAQLHVERVALAVRVERLLVEPVGPRAEERNAAHRRLRLELVDRRVRPAQHVLALHRQSRTRCCRPTARSRRPSASRASSSRTTSPSGGRRTVPRPPAETRRRDQMTIASVARNRFGRHATLE